MRINKRHCNNCGKYYEGRGEKYCSSKCCSQVVSPFVKGHKYRHNNNKGHKKGNIPWNKGNKINIEQSKGYSIKRCKHCKKRFGVLWKKNQEFCSNSCANIGNLNSQWMGGISFEPYLPEFNNQLKEQIRKRDDYTCQECNHTQEQLGYKVPIHHIDYNKKNNNPDNLISLCRGCHAQTNFDRNGWKDYFKQKVISFAEA